MTATTNTIRCRLDGFMFGVRGPVNSVEIDRAKVAGVMGWQDAGRAADTITRVMELIAEGRAVRVKSHAGVTEFLPLADGEDGLDIPASARRLIQI